MKIIQSAFLFLIAIWLVRCSKNNGGTNEQLPTISIGDVSATEGTGGKKAFELEVTLSKPFSKAVSVRYRTVDGTAVAGEDYIAVTEGILTIQPHETRSKITIEVIGDDIREGDETFMVRLSNPVNAVMIRESGTATIRNDDTRIALSNKGYEAPAAYAGYSLIWNDEFNGNALDQAAWSYDMGDGCPALCGWGNNELQYYTNSADNLFFQDGKMIIEARQQAVGGKNYTSARIKTAGKKAFRFGRIDIRAKLPKGKGIWPALWMLPQNNTYGSWPRSGEIDIMELVGQEPGKVHGTLHYGPGPGSTQINNTYTLNSGTFYDEFQVFSLEWQPDVIRWYVDGNLYATAEKSAFGGLNYPFNEEFYMLINLAVGGNWPGSPDVNTLFPQYLVVDYVRVYQ